MNDKIPWVIKYAPSSISDMVMNDDLKNMFLNMINSHSINNMTLTGTQGIGKTTLAKLLTKELNCDVKLQSCSADGSIDMIKTSILDFTHILSIDGKFKVIILDEADQISQQGQMALRNIIVDSMEDTRFILTCNYIDKIIPAIQSRCTPIKIDFSIEDITKHILKIFKIEGIDYTKENVKVFYNNVIKKQYPDIRSIIERAELACNDGTLQLINGINLTSDNEAINFILNNEDPLKIREFLLNNEDKFSGNYEQLASLLFNVYSNDINKMLIISEHLYKMSQVFDKEIQFTSMIINIKKIK